MLVLGVFLILAMIGGVDANALATRTTAEPATAAEETLAARTHANSISRKDINTVREALEKFYVRCGYFPDHLQRLFEAHTEIQNCKQPQRAPILQPTSTNQDIVSRLNYTPYGYDDYELGIRLFWTDTQ